MAADKAKQNIIRVMLADDHTVVRQALAAMISQERDMTMVAEAGNGRQAVDLWKEHRRMLQSWT